MPQDLLKRGNELGALASAQTGLQYNPIPETPETITSANLTAVTPITIPSAPPSTEASSFGSYLEGLSKNTAKAAEQRDNSFENLLSSFTEDTPTSLSDQAYSAPGGVDDLSFELNDINAQLLGEQEGLRREIERIQDNAEGLTRSGVAGKIDEAERRSYRKQADLSVIQMAKQGRYDSAKAIADRAVSAILEKQKQRNENLRFIYEKYEDIFTKAEQREFDVKQTERERQLANQEYRLRAEFDAKIKQSDPLYQAQLAKARYELSNTLQGSLPKQATPLQISKMQDTINDVRDLAKDPALRGAVGTTPFGRFSPVQAFTGAKSNFIASVGQLTKQLTLENLQNAKANGATFGALSEGELILLSSAATKIGEWEIRDDNDKVTGYKTDAVSFQKELDTINYFQKLDYLLKGGDPASVGIQVTPDGKFWTENSDETLSELIPQL